MKKASLVKCMALLIGSALPIIAFAQNPSDGGAVVNQSIALKVNGSAMLAVYNTNANAGSSTAVSMSLSGATQAGAAVMDEASNSDTRLRISSLVESGKTRTITASIAPAITNTGTQFFVKLDKPANFLPSVDNGGTPASELELTDGTSKTIVTDITTCWSGFASTDGYKVTYRYAKKANATFLQSQNIIITYTITAEG